MGDHDAIITLLDAFESPTHVELVLELMDGGELYGRIASKGAFPEPAARVIARRLVDAVKYMHKNNVVHRDLKPENILMRSGPDDTAVKVRVSFWPCLDAAGMTGEAPRPPTLSPVQIADFGLSKLLVNQTRMSTVCGTWAYSAPEVRVFRQHYDNKVDIWSLGVIMFTMYVQWRTAPAVGTTITRRWALLASVPLRSRTCHD